MRRLLWLAASSAALVGGPRRTRRIAPRRVFGRQGIDLRPLRPLVDVVEEEYITADSKLTKDRSVIKSDGEVLGFDDYSLTRPRHAAVVALDRVVAVIFTQRTLDAIGRRDAHVLSTIVRAEASSGHDQL